MDINQLKYFLAIAKYQSMTEAADELFISQSALSKQLNQLETEIGVSLFDRRGRQLHLTTAGQDFAMFATDVLAKQDAVLTKIKNYLSASSPALTLGLTPFVSNYNLPSALKEFCNEHPDFTLNIKEDTTENIIAALDNDEIELAIMRDFSLPEHSYKIMPLVTDYLVLVAAKNHRLGEINQTINLAALKDEKFLLLNSPAPNIYRSICERAGFTPRADYFATLQTLLNFVAADFGISLVREKDLAAFDTSKLNIYPLAEKHISNIALIFPHGRHLSPAAIRLQNHLLAYFKTSG